MFISTNKRSVEHIFAERWRTPAELPNNWTSSSLNHWLLQMVPEERVKTLQDQRQGYSMLAQF